MLGLDEGFAGQLSGFLSSSDHRLVGLVGPNGGIFRGRGSRELFKPLLWWELNHTHTDWLMFVVPGIGDLQIVDAGTRGRVLRILVRVSAFMHGLSVWAGTSYYVC
jgi:hypothetical protein